MGLIPLIPLIPHAFPALKSLHLIYLNYIPIHFIPIFKIIIFNLSIIGCIELNIWMCSGSLCGSYPSFPPRSSRLKIIVFILFEFHSTFFLIKSYLLSYESYVFRFISPCVGLIHFIPHAVLILNALYLILWITF